MGEVTLVGDPPVPVQYAFLSQGQANQKWEHPIQEGCQFTYKIRKGKHVEAVCVQTMRTNINKPMWEILGFSKVDGPRVLPSSAVVKSTLVSMEAKTFAEIKELCSKRKQGWIQATVSQARIKLEQRQSEDVMPSRRSRRVAQRAHVYAEEEAEHADSENEDTIFRHTRGKKKRKKTEKNQIEEKGEDGEMKKDQKDKVRKMRTLWRTRLRNQIRRRHTRIR